MKFACPACSQHIECESDCAGMHIECPTCKAPMIVPAAPAAASSCPNCGKPVAADATLCVACGTNVKTGARFEPPKPGAVRGKPRGLSAAAEQKRNTIIVAAVVLGLGGLFVLGRMSSVMGQLFLLVAALYGVVISIWIIVEAFRDGVAQGFLTLCIPCYELYFVYARCENSLLRILVTIAFITKYVVYYFLANP